MIKLLARKFVPNYKNPTSPRSRQVYGILCGIVSTVLNILLFTVKFIAGTMIHSVTMVADAFNNLSDAGTTIASIFGSWIAGMGAGKKHTFGHGRYEWIVSLFTSLLIMFMAFELCRSSILKIQNPSPIEFNLIIGIMLGVSILIKLYMFLYNRKIAKITDSLSLKATANDCISDAVSTLVVLISAIVETQSGLLIDGWSGLLISLFVFRSGFVSMKAVIWRMMGVAPNKELLSQIDDIVKSNPVVINYYDLMVHDYGFGRYFVSMRISGNSTNDETLIEAADNISYELYKTFGTTCVIQPELIITDTEITEPMKANLENAVSKSIYPHLSMDNFRMKKSGIHTYVVFDLIIPLELNSMEDEIKLSFEKIVVNTNSQYRTKINCKIFHDHNISWTESRRIKNKNIFTNS